MNEGDLRARIEKLGARLEQVVGDNKPAKKERAKLEKRIQKLCAQLPPPQPKSGPVVWT